MDWLNNNWKQYITRDDRVVMHSQIVRGAVKFYSVLGAAFIGLLGATMVNIFVMVFNDAVLHYKPIWNWPLWGAMAILFAMLAGRFIWLLCVAEHFILSQNGVYKISGLIAKEVKFVPYARITDVRLSRDVIGHFTNSGNVGISTASGGDISVKTGRVADELTIVYIADYQKTYDYIMNRIK